MFWSLRMGPMSLLLNAQRRWKILKDCWTVQKQRGFKNQEDQSPHMNISWQIRLVLNRITPPLARQKPSTKITENTSTRHWTVKLLEISVRVKHFHSVLKSCFINEVGVFFIGSLCVTSFLGLKIAVKKKRFLSSRRRKCLHAATYFASLYFMYF